MTILQKLVRRCDVEMFESQDFRQQFLTKMYDTEELYMYTKTKTTSLYLVNNVICMLFLSYTEF